MAGFSTYIIFTSVLCQLTVTAASRTLKEVAGALDGSVTFTLNITEIKVDYVVWAFNTFFLAMVKDNDVTSQRRKEGIIFPDGHYSMKLSQLKKNDSGAYRAEIHSSSTESPFIQEFVLQVYEYLSRPTVTMDWQSNENGTCIINLTCSMDQEGENVMYSWKAVGGNEFHDGANLPISWRSGEKDKTLICMARNPVSNSSSTPIFVQKLCEDSAKDLNSPRGILYILFITAVFIPLSALVIIIHTRWTQKGKGLEEDEKRVESHPEMPNSCPHLEENTAYDTIPYIEKRRPEEDAANTLYSTVQIPKEVKSPSSLPAKPHTLRPLSFENVI